MTRLVDFNSKLLKPIHAKTPIVTELGRPTLALMENERHRTEVLNAQFGNVKAGVETYVQAIADALGAGALKIDTASAEYDDLVSAIEVKMEAKSAPTGVSARYQVTLTAGSDYSTGMTIDLIDEGGGSYSGSVNFDTDKFTIGTANDNTAPFRVSGGTVYIQKAIIEDLSLATGKLANNAVTKSVTTSASGKKRKNSIARSASINADAGVVTVEFSGFFDRPSQNSSNFGNWRMNLRRGSSGAGSGGVIAQYDWFYDDDIAYPIYWLFEDENPVVGATRTYSVQLLNLSGQGAWTARDCVMRLMNVKK